jgi:hypothetical protein
MTDEELKTGEVGASQGTSWGAVLRALLLFFMGFVAAAAALHFVIGDDLTLYAAARSEKLELLKRSGHGATSAMLGSSHVNQGFDPREFDATLAGTSLAAHSINLGIDGGTQIEQRDMALAFLRGLEPAKDGGPCFVMLEQNATPSFSSMFNSHPRQINILGWRALGLVLQFPPEGYRRPNQIHRRLMLLNAAFDHEVNLGMLSNRIFRPALNESVIREETMNDQRGLHHVSSNAMEQADVERVWSQRHVPPRAVPADLQRGDATIMEDLHRAPNGDRAQMVWVVMPRLNDLSAFHVFPSSESTSFGAVPILDLARPDLFPELYDRSLWVDSQHLNEEGSTVFSRILAKQLLDWSRDHPMRGCGG